MHTGCAPLASAQPLPARSPASVAAWRPQQPRPTARLQASRSVPTRSSDTMARQWRCGGALPLLLALLALSPLLAAGAGAGALPDACMGSLIASGSASGPWGSSEAAKKHWQILGSFRVQPRAAQPASGSLAGAAASQHTPGAARWAAARACQAATGGGGARHHRIAPVQLPLLLTAVLLTCWLPCPDLPPLRAAQIDPVSQAGQLGGCQRQQQRQLGAPAGVAASFLRHGRLAVADRGLEQQ